MWLFDRLVWAVVGVWSGDMGVKGEGEGGGVAREVSEMGVGGGLVHTGVHGVGGATAGHDEGKGGYEGLDI